MSKYLNRKEQVIELELTSYGKKQFAAGKLTPKFYSFHDDDILYDSEYGISGSIKNSRPKVDQESQNEVVSRIKDTPRLSTYEINGWQKAYSFYESSRESQNENTNFLDSSPDRVTLANAKFFRAIGTSSPLKDFAPAWEVKAMDDSEPLEISGTENFPYRNGASGSETIIPFFSASLPLEYDVSTIRLSVDENNVIVPGGENQISREVFELTKDGRLLLDVQELNTFFKGNGNFDVEVFKLTKNPRQNGQGNNNQEFQRLSFINEEFRDADSMRIQTEPDIYATVLAGGDEVIDRNIPKIDPTYVEYYLSLRVDNEIEDVTAVTGDSLYVGGLNAPIDPCEDD